MANKTTAGERITIRRVLVPRWTGLGLAAKALKVSGTQVRRHVSGHEFSGELDKKMKKLGITVEHKV